MSQLASEDLEALLHPEAQFWTEQAPSHFEVRFVTSEGDFVAAVTREQAPIGVDRFYNLVRAGFYDDSRFFRVRPAYIAQFGIAGDPEVSAVWRERTMPDDTVRASNIRGSFAYAMTGPNSR
ncbi:MAG: peptidylprolyl isomerase, partial [Acidobacteriota bacterium]